MATILNTRPDPAANVFGDRSCDYCNNTGLIDIDDDDGHPQFRTETAPCPFCEERDQSEYWADMDAAIQYHRDMAELVAPHPADDWTGDDVPF